MADFNFNMNFSGPKLNTSVLGRFLDSPNGEVGRDLTKRGRRIVAAAKAQVGVDTSQLRDAIHMRHIRISGGPAVWIGADVDHALAHHNGTRPHTITANGPQMMRFSAGGRMVYTRSVLHPGTAPNRYLSDNLRLANI